MRHALEDAGGLCEAYTAYTITAGTGPTPPATWLTTQCAAKLRELEGSFRAEATSTPDDGMGEDPLRNKPRCGAEI